MRNILLARYGLTVEVLKMDFRENIKYRESMEVRACQGEKWTPEEKAWAAMNPIYSPLYDHPVFLP